MGFLSSRQKMGVAAVILAASAFASRLMGLARDKIISWQFGASGEADMYFAAFVVPDIINYLLAGAFMSITIIPILGRGFAKDESDTWRFFSCVTIWMFLASSICTIIGEFAASGLAAVIAPGFSEEQCRRLAGFMRLILPGQVFFLTGSCFTALLLLRRQFSVPALTPLVYNGSIILFGLCAPLLLPEQDRSAFGMSGYCIGVTIGAGIGAFALPFYVARKGGIRFSFVWRHPWMKEFLIIALPLMLGQTVVMLDEQFLRVFGSMLEEGSVSLLNYGRRIAQVPVALMGQALAVASYPFLVKLLAQNEKDRFDATLRSALCAGVQLIIPCGCLMLALAEPILGLIFEGGRFGVAETLACAPLTRLLLLPAPLWIIYMVLSRGYYAYGDTLTPAITGTIITIFCLPFYYFYAVRTGAWAITAVSGAAIGAYVLWLALIWRKRHGGAAFYGLGFCALKSGMCSLPAAVMAWLLAMFMKNSVSPGLFSYFLILCSATLVFVSLFAIFAWRIDPELLNKILLRLRVRK